MAKLDRVTNVVYNGSVSGETGSFTNNVTYTYKNDATYGESGLVETYTSTVGDASTSYTYAYDSNGNIITVTGNGSVMHYTYDDLGQLIKESPGFGGYIYNYTYDNAGNITKIQVSSTNSVLYPATYVKNFEYSDSAWGDLLVAVNNSSIAYDNIGNPTTYYNGFTFTWEGRRLVGATKGADTYSFTYNEDGLRTSKTKNGVTTNYYYSGSLLVKEESSTQTIVYLYDANGSPVGFKYRTPSCAEDVWDEYFYEKNMFGDIVAVYNASGTKLISYTYDAWGNFTTSYHNGGASTTATNNPYTYRGYYYDSDLELYYLQSRYYDSNTCRFINADEMMSGVNGSLKGFNLYAYCFNNPVMMTDSEGNWPDWFQKKTDSAKNIVTTFIEGATKVNEVATKIINKVDAIITEAKKDVGNTDVDVVYNSTHASYYNEALVIKHSGENISSFAILGIIFLNRNTPEDKYKQTLDHEYGHILQEKELGTGLYFAAVALPSVSCNYIPVLNKYAAEYYYSLPWEYDADMRGGVDRGDYQPWAEKYREKYFDLFR